MAYNLRNINVLDLNTSTGVGVAIPFDKPSAFTTVYTTNEQLKYNIINYLLSDPRERIFNPNFGAGLRARLFEQITEESNEALKNSIKAGVEAYFPTVKVEELEILSQPDSNTINVLFSYRVLTNGEQDNITISVQNG